MFRIPGGVRVTFFVSLHVLSAALWLYLARRMPLRYFAWFSLLAAGYAAVELVMVNDSRGKIQ